MLSAASVLLAEVSQGTDPSRPIQTILKPSTAFVADATAPAPARATAGSSVVAGVAGFQIEISFPDSTLTAAQQQIFVTAANRWAQVITGDLPDVTTTNGVVDDLRIEASAPAIDGPGGILGQAGPTAMRSGARGLPYAGVMQFDSADVASMMNNGTFKDVILHEMGHVLGLGTLWTSFGLLSGASTSNPQFTGTNAAREYSTIAGMSSTSVPVENTGGSGTRNGHWRESTFDTELMTGWAEAAGVPMPLSRVTVGQFQDLGYTVDYAAADPYSLPGGTPGGSRTITVSNATVTEGNSGTVNAAFVFTLSSAASSAVTVQYVTRDGTATVADQDYVTKSGTVSFAAGETSKVVNVVVNGDTKVEADETFTLALSNAVGATLAASTATATIKNDDTSPTPPPTPAPSLPTLSIADVSVAEGNVGTATARFVATLSTAASSTVTVEYQTADDTATIADGDYVPTRGVLQIPAGQLTGTFTVLVRGDQKNEPDETFKVTLTNPNGATLARPAAKCTILNDDDPSQPTAATISIDDATLQEGNSGTSYAAFNVSLSSAQSSVVTVAYSTSDGTATQADRDYASASGSIVFQPGETLKTVRVGVIGDTKIENDETFSVSLSSPQGGSLSRATGTGTIRNDDVASTSTVSIADARIVEGNIASTTMSFAVTLSAAAAGPMSVKFRTADGSATAGTDYAAASGEIRFAKGGIQQVVTIWVRGDRLVENDETFTVQLFDPVGVSLGRSTATGTIVDDDTAAIQAAMAQWTAAESERKPPTGLRAVRAVI